jgi:hypothetical protein
LKINPLFAVLALGLATPALAAQDAAPAAPEAPAAQAATAKAGDTVYDSAGVAVGTIESVSGENFVLSTGSSKATLPVASLGSSAAGPSISITKAQLETAIAQAATK